MTKPITSEMKGIQLPSRNDKPTARTISAANSILSFAVLDSFTVSFPFAEGVALARGGERSEHRAEIFLIINDFFRVNNRYLPTCETGRNRDSL